METRSSFFRLSTVVILAVAVGVSCAKKEEEAEGVSDSASNMGDFAQGAMGGVAGETEDGTVGTSAMPYWFPEEQAHYGTLSTCTWTSARTNNCSATTPTLEIDWGGCTPIGTSLTLTGGWTSTFNSTAACNSLRLTGGSTGLGGSGNHVTRTASSGFIVRFASGAKLTTSTEAHTAYDGTAIPATGVRVDQTSATATDRTITIYGLHRVLRGPRGTKWFDHSLKTNSAISVTGSRANGNRTVNGTLVVFHNIASYTATNVMTNVKWETSTCCYPTSGTIATTFTGSVTGTATTTFTSTCGSASFTNTSNTTSTVTLTACE